MNAAACALVIAFAIQRPSTNLGGDASAQLAAFIDDFVADGLGEGAAGELSAKYYADQLKRAKTALARLRSIERARLSTDESIDWRFAESVLVGRELVQERNACRVQTANGTAVFVE